MTVERNNIYTIIENRPLTAKTMLMRLEGDTSGFNAPGQFVNVAIDGKFLRRPISVADYDAEGFTLLYDIVGEGTEWMSRRKAGEKLDILPFLGNGFSIDPLPERPVLLGGGIGTAPMLGLAKALRDAGTKPVVVLGHNTAADVAMEDMLQKEGIEVYVSTVDGSDGTKGFVTDVIREKNLDPDYFYACGPMPMMKAVFNSLPCEGQLSLEARMGCGFGACVCCSLETTKGSKRICKEGPIFRKEELIWK